MTVKLYGTSGCHLCDDAELFNLQVIGEAVKRLSPALTAAENAVPWRQIACT